jgi:hypothetical protein
MYDDEPKSEPLTLGVYLFHTIKRFVYSQNRKPVLIVMHPSDIDSLAREMTVPRVVDSSKDISFMGIKVLRSFDVEQGKPVIA